MRSFAATPWEMVHCLWRHRELIGLSARREVLGRYRGSWLGLLWSFFNPLLMLAVYTFVFGEIFKARWNADSTSRSEFALVLFAGLIAFNLFAECVNRAPHLVLANVNYVKKVVFPLEILPFVSLLSALFHGAISLGVWLLAYLFLVGMPQATALYLPVVLLPLLLFIVGVCWGLAALAVYLRDVGQFVGVLTSVLMFLSPVFYPSSALPERYRNLLDFNPLTPAVEQLRAVLYFGQAPDLARLAVECATAFGVAWLGFSSFQKMRGGFADVL